MDRFHLRRWMFSLFSLVGIATVELALQSSLGWQAMWQAVSAHHELTSVAELSFFYSALPRMVLGILVGASLGCAGSLLQQMTRNPLVSPMTLGSASGAWMTMVAATIWWPALAASYPEYIALSGALLSAVLMIGITGIRGISGLSVVLTGMALSLLMGALASGMVMLHDQYAQSLFVWGAGDLTQMDWRWVAWFWPRVMPVLLLLPFVIRPLQLMRIGQQGAQDRGLKLWPVILLIFLISLWLTALSVACVGLIGFISLLTPQIARTMGARTVAAELLMSAILGALLLLVTDCVALALGHWTRDLIPSGAAAAFIGAPALIWLSRSRLSPASVHDTIRIQHRIRTVCSVWLIARISLLALVGLSIPLWFQQSVQGWQIGFDPVLWSYAWPRWLAALASGIGLSVAGVVLQRLLKNPMASPDMLGVSAGATLALLLVSGLTGVVVQQVGVQIAFLGCLVVMGLLYWLGRRRQFEPGYLALVGIALGALLDGIVQLIMAKGDVNAFAILGWMVGSTYKVQAVQALILVGTVFLLSVLTCCFSRGLTLISVGDGMALGRGLSLSRFRLIMLAIVACFCALITTFVGPISFLGLLMPHLAHQCGARTVRQQLWIAGILGATLFVLADWVGQNLIYPYQLPAGLCASVICGTYFIFLLLKQRLQEHQR